MAKRVFFSFHYQDVIDFRANIVRNHWLTHKDRESSGFFDASIWEEAKTKGADNLKRLINSSLDNTSVTSVLIGEHTYDRRWVKYEICKSLERGNKLLGVHINKIKCKNSRIKYNGPDPFDSLAVQINASGERVEKFLEYDFSNSKWIDYQDLVGGYKIASRMNAHYHGKSFKLSEFYKCYDWVDNDGYNNFSTWVG